MNRQQMTLWPTSRRGSILPWFAVSLFVLLPLAALVIDMSLVRLTRRQMQTAVNSAALEGLRFRDSIPVSTLRTIVDCPLCATEEEFLNEVRVNDPECACTEATDQVVRDYVRRRLAQRITTAIYDDDLLSTQEDEWNVGAGPDVDYEGGIVVAGQFRAQPLIEPKSAYKPNPRLNFGTNDHPAGDFVAGSFDRNDTEHDEYSNYSRTDFTPADSDASIATAFLARLRRTEESNQVGIASFGPPVPFLFGRGGVTRALPPHAPDEIWNRRESGTIVRATAIANAVPAVTVGVPSAEIDVGLARFAMSRTIWESALLDIDLNVTRSGTDVTGDFIGRGIAQEVTTLGMEATATIVAPWEEGVRYVPIFVDETDERIVGFGIVRISSVVDETAVVRKLSDRQMAFANASATFTRNVPTDITSTEWSQVIFFSRELADTSGSNPLNHAPVLAPALQRTVP